MVVIHTIVELTVIRDRKPWHELVCLGQNAIHGELRRGNEDEDVGMQ